MSQIFHRSANTLSKVSIFGVLSPLGGLVLLALVIGRSPYATKQVLFVEPQDFLEFDHGDQPVHDRGDVKAREKEWFISAAAIGPVRV